jgi:DNA-binding response OmpR family regulator
VLTDDIKVNNVLATSREQVLLVENHESTREMMCFLMKHLGLSLFIAQTAAQALGVVKDQRFDLYILEVWLPEIDGITLCQRIRERDPIGQILFYSSAATPVAVEGARMAGADAYVIKPDIIGLISEIDGLLKNAALGTVGSHPAAVPFLSASMI